MRQKDCRIFWNETISECRVENYEILSVPLIEDRYQEPPYCRKKYVCSGGNCCSFWHKLSAEGLLCWLIQFLYDHEFADGLKKKFVEEICAIEEIAELTKGWIESYSV